MRAKQKPILNSSFNNKSLKSSTVKSELKNSAFQDQKVKMSSRRFNANEKQNMQTQNKMSPDLKFKDKTFRPKLRKMSNLELSSTVSLIINQSECMTKKNDLLDSLLYGQVDLTYSQDFHRKQQESDELLIDTCDQTINFKGCKILSPIKSISEYSLTEAQHHLFLLQKIDQNVSNVMLKIKPRLQKSSTQQTLQHNCVLLRRLVAHFTQKSESIIKFYCAVHQAASREDLLIKVRGFLFTNAIIFNKNQLKEMIDYMNNKITQINKISGNYIYSQENIQLMLEEALFSIQLSNSQNTQTFWLQEDIMEKLFYDKDITSVWKLILTLCSEASTQVQASFRESRFCLSRDSTQFIHETDEKRKQEIISKIQKWLSTYLKPHKTSTQKFTLINR